MFQILKYLQIERIQFQNHFFLLLLLNSFLESKLMFLQSKWMNLDGYINHLLNMS